MRYVLFSAIICIAAALSAANARAVTIAPDNVFVLDFIANGDGSTGLSNLSVAVYWAWDGTDMLSIRMETDSSVGFGNFWSLNTFSGGSSPGGLDGNGSNNTVTVISAGGALSATSLGAFAGGVDAIEASWDQPSAGGAFDPSLDLFYIQLTMLGPSGPSDGYRMAEYLTDGGTYSNAPDIFNPMDGSFCAVTDGSCAFISFSAEQPIIPEPSGLLLFSAGALVVGRATRRRAA